MDEITKTRIKDGLLTLPQPLAQTWQNRDVVIYPERDRLIVQALEADWDAYEEKLRKGSKYISSHTIDEASRKARE